MSSQVDAYVRLVFRRSTIELKHCGPMPNSKYTTTLFWGRLFWTSGCGATVWA